MDEKELERLAQEELLAEVKRGKVREETMGMLAWKKSPVPRPNKRFLTNMLMSTREPKRKKTESKDSRDDRDKKYLPDHKRRSEKSDDDYKRTSSSNSSSSKRHSHHEKRKKSKHKKKHKSEK